MTLITLALVAKGSDSSFLRPPIPLITWLAGISSDMYLLHQEPGYLLATALLEVGLTGAG